ncbi:MAG TPA: anti-sigma factor antagonist [Bacteroidetes bacterium]|nr:anti-sigma factor antagonist [Bacteroidota bacterium]
MSSFEVQRKDDGPVTTLYLKGYLDAHTAPELENAFQKLVEEKRFNVVVSMADLTYISSAGMGVFMGFIETMRENRGDIKLSELPPKIYRVFDLLGFPLLYEVYEKEEQALKKFHELLGESGEKAGSPPEAG